MNPSLRIAGWTLVGVVFGAAVLSLACYLSIPAPSGPIDFLDVYKWQFALLLVWVFIAPVVVQGTIWLEVNGYHGWPLWMSMALFGLVTFAAHAIWVGAVSFTFSPYPSLAEFKDAIDFHMRFGLPVDLAVFALLVVHALRIAANIDREESERRMLDLLRHLPGMAYRMKNDGRWSFEYASPGAEALTGWAWYELVEPGGPTMFDIGHPEDVAAGYEKVKEALRLQLPYQLYYRLRTRSGEIKWAFEQGRGVYNEHGDPIAVEGFISDTTAQKTAEIALAESERRFRNFFEDAVFGVFRSTADGRFLMVNQSVAESLGYETPEEVIESVTDLGRQIYVNPGDREVFLERIRMEGFVKDFEWQMRTKDGRLVWNSETSRGVFDDGELSFIEGTVKDITAEKRANQALIESERRAGALRVQLANAQLRALKLQIKPHFLFNILNTVAMMIRSGDTAGAQQVVTMLGDMFRYFLDFEGEDTLSLERELEFVDLYLGLEEYRFSDRMLVERDFEAAALDRRVPTLILQPIVENAVKHGVATRSGQCRIGIGARIEADKLVIEVANDIGTRSDRAESAHRGIGVTNTKSRLMEMYGERAAFRLELDDSRAVATLTIPLEEGGS